MSGEVWTATAVDPLHSRVTDENGLLVCVAHHLDVDLITAAPELADAARDIVGDLELFCSRQGLGPDKRLARLKEILLRIPS